MSLQITGNVLGGESMINTILRINTGHMPNDRKYKTQQNPTLTFRKIFLGWTIWS